MKAASDRRDLWYTLCTLYGQKYLDARKWHSYSISVWNMPSQPWVWICSYNNLHSSGSGSQQMLDPGCRGQDTRTLVRTSSDAGWSDLAHRSQSMFQFITKVLDEDEVKFFHIKPGKAFLHAQRLLFSCLNRKQTNKKWKKRLLLSLSTLAPFPTLSYCLCASVL